KRSLIKSVLRQIINEKFDGDKGTTRVTLFKKVGGTYALIKLFPKICLRHGYTHFRKGCLGYHIKNLPLPGREYLLIYAREAWPHENGSSTYFLVPHDEAHIKGWTPWALYTSRTVHTELPKIDSE